MLKKSPAKWIFYGYIHAFFSLRNLVGSTTPIEIFGDIPARPYLQWKIFRLLGLVPVKADTNTPSGKLSYSHTDATNHSPTPGINGRCSDISKSRVEKVFADVFGYSLAVDPLTYHGKIVRKSEVNAAHDGIVLQGPLTEASPDFVYQVYVDASTQEGNWIDLRTCVVGKELPFVYVKSRPLDLKFANHGNTIWDSQADQIFSAEELKLLLEFADAMGLDIGEMDVLRDNNSGKIYVVDIAKTPHSPSDNFITLGGVLCMHKAAASFRRQFLPN